MRRREFIAALVAAACPVGFARAQTSKKPKVGILWHAGSAGTQGAYYTAVIRGFRDLGYIDGQNITLEHRFANEVPERFRSMASELVALNVDVLVTVGPQTAPYVRGRNVHDPRRFHGRPRPGR